jgi:phosphate transport system substrate-binding protein
MSDAELARVKGGAVLLPMTAGEIVVAYNLKGIKDLKLSREVYPEIFMGKITRWNDPKIAAANPGVTLPDEPITVVVRSDSSGTSYVFTGHLSAVSPAFKAAIGQDKSPQWPNSDKLVKAPKNAGITATIRQTPGAIGHIEYGYAKLTRWQGVALLQNRSGAYVAAGPAGGAAALASAQFPSASLPGE